MGNDDQAEPVSGTRFTATETPTAVDNVEIAVFEGAAILFDEPAAMLHRLGAIAGGVWLYCDGATDVAAMVAELADTFRVDLEEMAEAVDLILGRFADEGLLVEPDPAPRNARPGERLAEATEIARIRSAPAPRFDRTETETETFGAAGFTFRISSPDADVVAAFDDVLVDMRTGAESAVRHILVEPHSTTGGSSTTVRVLSDGEVVHESLAVGSVVSHVLMEVNLQFATAAWAAGSLPLHASTVAGPDGAVLLAGASHVGKTTLATAFALEHGHRTTLLADEVSALNPNELVVAPYGKPVALRAPGLDLLAPRVARLQRPGSDFERDERFVPPSELGAAPTSSAPVSAIVFPRFVPTSSVTPLSQLDVVPPDDTLMRLMELALGGRPPKIDAFRSLEQLVRDVDAFELTFSDAFDAADRLGDVFGRRNEDAT